MIKSILFGRGEITRRLKFDGWNCQLQFRPRDLWIGLYYVTEGHCVDAWICLVPCVPIHLSWWYHDSEQ